MTKKLILFDFDGTVIDNSEGIFNCIKYALDKAGTPCPDPATLRRFVGPALNDSYRRYIADDPEAAERFVSDYRERYAPIGHTECVLYPGIRETLRRLNDEGFICAVCSGKPLQFVEKIVKLLDVGHLFSGLFCPGFANRSSSKEELILEAVRHFGVTEAETLMVGDTVFDIRSAKAAGIASMGVTYGFSEPGELTAEGADCLAFSPAMIYNTLTSVCPCVIFGAGEYGDRSPDLPADAYVIAADGGYDRCRGYGVVPDLLIGDLDSVGGRPAFDGPTVILPTKKDVTDTDAAVAKGLAHGCKEFIFYGCDGGRPDHTLANLAIMKRLSRQGIRVSMVGRTCTYVAVTDGTLPLPAREKGYISVFALRENCVGVFEKGLKYSLDDAALTDTFALGVSNEFTGQDAEITVKDGTLLVIYENDL